MMEKLWAPWRMQYVKKARGRIRGCFFCQYLREKRDQRHFIVQRSPHSFSILNLYPYNNGHLMIVPNRHVKDLERLTSEERKDLIDLFMTSKKLCEKTLHPRGFNAGINFGRVGGAGIEDHLHIHLVPRWIGDTNFMPVVGSTKVISQSLKALYHSLRKNLKRG